MECVGLNATINTALEIAGFGARVVLFGMADPEKPVPFNQYAAITKELDIQTSFLNPHTMGRAISLLAKGAVNAEELISKVMTPEEMVQELADRTWTRKGKPIVKWKEFE